MVGLATFDEMAGGSARYLSGLAEAARALGTKSTSSPRRGMFLPPETGARPSRSGARKPAPPCARPSQLFVDVMRTRPDVVNVHFALDGIGAVLAAVATGTRSSSTSRTMGGPGSCDGGSGRAADSTSVRRAIEKRAYRRADARIVLSAHFVTS